MFDFEWTLGRKQNRCFDSESTFQVACSKGKLTPSNVKVPGIGFRVRVQVLGLKVYGFGSGFDVEALGFKIELRLRFKGLRFKVNRSRSRVWRLRFRV